MSMRLTVADSAARPCMPALDTQTVKGGQRPRAGPGHPLRRYGHREQHRPSDQWVVAKPSGGVSPFNAGIAIDVAGAVGGVVSVTVAPTFMVLVATDVDSACPITPSAPSETTAAPPATAANNFTLWFFVMFIACPSLHPYVGKPAGGFQSTRAAYVDALTRLEIPDQLKARRTHSLSAASAGLFYPVSHTAGTDRMTRFLVRRLLNYIVLLALASFLTFTLTAYAFAPLDSL